MSRLVKLRGAGKPRGPGAYDGDFLPGSDLGGLGGYPSFLKTLVDYGALYAFYGDRGLVNAQNARPLAGSGAYPARELGEIVRLVKSLESLSPKSRINQVVPLGYKVVYGASRGHAADYLARLAERDPAVHAPCALSGKLFFGKMAVKLVPVGDSAGRIPVRPELPFIIHKTCGITH